MIKEYKKHVAIEEIVDCPSCDGSYPCHHDPVLICKECECDWPCETVQAYNYGVDETEVKLNGRITMSTLHILHEKSGLTWEQLSKLFGVSRNALMNWSVGGKMTLQHRDILNELLGVVSDLPADNPSSRRELLFAHDDTGTSIYERFCKQYYREEVDS